MTDPAWYRVTPDTDRLLAEARAEVAAAEDVAGLRQELTEAVWAESWLDEYGESLRRIRDACDAMGLSKNVSCIGRLSPGSRTRHVTPWETP